jgi:hypothetical protein
MVRPMPPPLPVIRTVRPFKPKSTPLSCFSI